MLSSGNEGDSLAIPNEDGGLAWGDKDEAILAIVDINIGSDVKDKEGALPTPVNIVLLLLNGVDRLDFK